MIEAVKTSHRFKLYIYSFADAAKKAIDGEFDIAEVLSLVI